ncbi:MAG: hypothetical protein ACC645_03610, partial [Pirellulales bacterium]
CHHVFTLATANVSFTAGQASSATQGVRLFDLDPCQLVWQVNELATHLIARYNGQAVAVTAHRLGSGSFFGRLALAAG